MPGHDERDERDQQRWRARFAKERRGLSDSMNEALADPRLQDDFSDEPDATGQDSQKMLVVPRLSLQSKPLPAVRIVPKTVVKPQQSAQPPETNNARALPAASKKKRLAGRTTKVHLQAVPKTEKRGAKKMASSPGIVDSTIVAQAAPALALPGPPIEARTNERVTERHVTVPLNTDERPARERLAGLGQFLQGQAELTIENSHVSESSVVMANLLGNPGPVVVQYYTLLPGYGFKIHRSAPVTANTPFNYVILLGELF